MRMVSDPENPGGSAPGKVDFLCYRYGEFYLVCTKIGYIAKNVLKL